MLPVTGQLQAWVMFPQCPQNEWDPGTNVHRVSLNSSTLAEKCLVREQEGIASLKGLHRASQYKYIKIEGWFK